MKPKRRVVEGLLTIAQVVEVTGLSRGAVEARIRRGSLPAVHEGRHVRVPLAALYEAGLLRAPPPGTTIADLVDRIERQAETIGELRERVRRAEER